MTAGIFVHIAGRYGNRAKPRQHGARFINAPHMLKKAGGFRQEGAQSHQQKTGGKVEKPHDAPAEHRL